MTQDSLRAIEDDETTADVGESTTLETDDQLVPADVLTREELASVESSRDFFALLRKKDFDFKKLKNAIGYEQELRLLQIELIKLQRWLQDHDRRVAILFEGRDAAGKGGTIRRFVEHLNPRYLRVVALPEPNEEEAGQWYFQRYIRQLPNPGELVFFDRSWYNRAVVEPVNGFCADGDYERFMRQVPEFEHMLYEDGLSVIKFGFSISKTEQQQRFEARRANPLKHWKLSPVDARAQELWDDYTGFKERMFSQTHTSFSPWVIVKANNKKRARLESMRHVLSLFDYDGKLTADSILQRDPNVVMRYHRSAKRLD